MNPIYILHIETSSTVCSVALSKYDEIIICKETNNGYTHAESLHVFINDILTYSNLKPSDFSAIAISTGPGSYTGLRIGYSTAKGLCYALNIPLIEVNTLQALTSSIINKTFIDSLYCPMIDARRMEVYTALFDDALTEVKKPQAMILNNDTITEFKTNNNIYFFGDGTEKAKDLILLHFTNHQFIPNVTASATHMVKLAYQKFNNKQFSDYAYAEPLYLKEFFFTPPKNRI